MSPSLAYWPALDGLRAVAVLSVMLFHAHSPALPGGFLGVDIFFVISGFLITAQLQLLQAKPGGLHYGAFLLRRAARLQPALWAMLLTCVALWQTGLMPLAPTAPVAEFFVVVLGIGNWARSFGVYPLEMWGHTWSLGIEEQFYLLWPLLLLGMHRMRWRLATQFCLVVGLALASAGLMAWMHQQGSGVARLYNGTDTRAHALLLGAALALVRQLTWWDGVPGKWRDRCASGTTTHMLILGWLGIAGLGVLLISADWKAPAMYQGGYFLTGLLTALLVAQLTRSQPCWVARVLSVRLLVYIGTLSYSLYLWHYPLYRWAEHLASGWAHPHARLWCLALATLVTLMLAAASQRWLELPLRKFVRKRYAP